MNISEAVDIKPIIYDGLLSSDMIIEDGDIDKLATSLTEDVLTEIEDNEDYLYLTEEEIIEQLVLLHNNGADIHKVKDLARMIYLESNDMAKQIHNELDYWLRNESNRSKL